MSALVLQWILDFKTDCTAMPTHLALKQDEYRALCRDLEGIYVDSATGIAMLFGLQIEFVPSDYYGARVWSSKPREDIKKRFACGSCGANWLPECNYCGRIG